MNAFKGKWRFSEKIVIFRFYVTRVSTGYNLLTFQRVFLIFIEHIVCNFEIGLEFCFHPTILEVLFTLLILFPDLIQKFSFLSNFSILLLLRLPGESYNCWNSPGLFNSSFNYDLITHSKCEAAVVYNILRSCQLAPCPYVRFEVCDQSRLPTWYIHSESN
jgi:hypothetical protein